MNEFVATMPDVYGRLYGASEVAEHAAMVSRRGARPVHAELWQSAKGPLLCVVAEDRPGLLALVTDALLAQGLAIERARLLPRGQQGTRRGRGFSGAARAGRSRRGRGAARRRRIASLCSVAE